MKNYLKFVIAVAAITIATFGSVSDAVAKVRPSAGTCDSCDADCGTSSSGGCITGHYGN
jgi:hypothetical protein